MRYDLQHALQRELRSDERLIWTGSPRGGIRLQAGDALMIPFTIMWAGFAFFWEYQVLETQGPSFFALWGIPFVVIGAYMLIGRFFYDAYKRSRTLYGITDQRVIILSVFPTRKVESISLASLGQTTVSERSDRSGTILFGPGGGMWDWFAGSGWPGASRHIAPRFEAIENVKDVHERILQARDMQRSITR